MKKIYFSTFIFFCFGLCYARQAHQQTESEPIIPVRAVLSTFEYQMHFDSIVVSEFFSRFPKLKDYRSEVISVYRKRRYAPIWFESGKLIDLGQGLHESLGELSDEGLDIEVPYKDNLDRYLSSVKDASQPEVDIELLVTALYFFYTQHVFQGVDDKSTDELGWHIPRKRVSFVTYLDTLLQKPGLLQYDESKMFKQYYYLKSALKRYRAMLAENTWKPILFKSTKPFSVGGSSTVIMEIRERLRLFGYTSSDSKSMKYDRDLAQAVSRYKKNVGLNINDSITEGLITSLNVPLESRIRTIIFNMERCRWIPASFNQVKEYIFINIPAFQMNYFKDDKVILNSKVVVGKTMNQTVIFSGMLQYIVFSPYWNVPKSIIEKEIKPAMRKNKNYLAEHNMEWNGGRIRQKPGPKNSLGLVKFLFPNSNSIYLHDTPSKSLFKEEKRTFSHGCIRLEKPVELAYLLVKDDKNWPLEKLNKAFRSKKEIWYTLPRKIPVYIGYFTAWSDSGGGVQFYDDVYARDECLTSFLFQIEYAG